MLNIAWEVFMSITVSVIDDNSTFRKSISQLVNSTDMLECIGVYGSVEDALKGLRCNMPQVVLMDIELPEMNGVEGTRLIKQLHPQLDVIMLTVFADADKIFKSIQAGASGYLLKKSEPSRIIEAIIDIRNGGSPMSSSVARVVMNALRDSQGNPPTSDQHGPLTDREFEILKLILEGLRYQQIAGHLFISVDTVRSHIRRIYEKLQVHSKTEALAEARKRGFF